MKNKRQRLLGICLAIIVSITMISPWQANDIAAFAQGDVTAESVSDVNAETDAVNEEDVSEADDGSIDLIAEIEATLPETLPADPREAVRLVAKSQLGYEEKSDEGNAAATGYGMLMGDETIAPWDAAFVVFALHYAAIIDLESDTLTIPIEVDSDKWVKELREEGLLIDAADFAPEKGDLIFLKETEDTDTHAGIVTRCTDEAITVIGATTDEESNKVVRNKYTADDVVGFVSLETIAPDQFAETEEEVTEEEAAADEQATEENIDAAAEDEEEAVPKEKTEVTDEEAAKEKADEVKDAEANPKAEAEADKTPADRQFAEQTVEADMVSGPGVGGKLSALGRKLTGSESNTVIKLSGVMPEGAVAEAYPVKVDVPGQKVLGAYDITIYAPVLDENGKPTDDMEEWQPEEPLAVLIRNDKIGNAAEDSIINVFHMENKKADLEEIDGVKTKGKAVGFKAESFSIYVVTEQDEELRVNYRFWLDKNDIGQTGREPSSIISLKDGEQLLEPAAPIDLSRGKYLGSRYADDDSVVDYPVTVDIPAGTTEDIDVDIYADYDGTQYATFMSLPVNGKRTVFNNAVMTKDGDTYLITNLPSYGGPNGYKFVGWTTTEPSDVNGYGTTIDEGDYYKLEDSNGDPTVISGQAGSITLYPVCKKMYNLTFDANGGLVKGLPVYKMLVTSDDSWEEALDTLGEVTRAGHTKNNGWFSGPDASDSAVSTSGEIVLTQDTTVYAHWDAATTKVIVKYWKEAVENSADHPVPYELIDSEEVTVPTGTTLTLDDSSMTIGNSTLNAESVRGRIVVGGEKITSGSFTSDPDLKYFNTSAITAYDSNGDYHSTSRGGNLDVTVAEDGSTIVDVWYNRTVYNITFVFKLDGALGTIFFPTGSGRINRTFGPYSIRLGEDISTRWPDLTASNLSIDLFGFGYTPVALGVRTNTDIFPEAVTSEFAAPLTYVTDELLDFADSSKNINLYGRYNQNTVNGGVITATVTERFEYISGGYTTKTKVFNYGRTSGVPYIAPTYPGYVLNINDTEAANGASNVRDNGDGTADITIQVSRPNILSPYTGKATTVYSLDTFTTYLNYGDTILAYDDSIKYTQPIKDYLEGSSISDVFADPTNAAGVPDYMEFGGWYTDEDCNEDYKLKNTTTMPSANVILYAKYTPKVVNVSIDNGKETADQTRTNPSLNMSGSEFGGSVRHLVYQNTDSIKYNAHEHTIAEFMPTYWTAPVWENHVFTGWSMRSKNSDGTWGNWGPLSDLNAIVDSDIELKGNWQDIERHSIHYMENGKEVYHDTNTYVNGTNIVIKGSDTEIYDRETETSQVFRYWTKEGDDETKYYPGDTITMGDSDITLNAHFSEGGTSSGGLKATYVFKIPGPLDSWQTYYEEIVYKSERLSPPPTDPVIAGKTFRGWYTDDTLKHKFNGFGNVNAPKDTVLYANFVENCQVTYLGYNDESITVQSYDKGDYLDITGVGSTYSHNGQTPTGWWPTKLEPGTTTGDSNYPYGYNGATNSRVNSSMTLYPVFEQAYTLTFDTGEGGTVLAPKVYGASENLNFTWPEPDDIVRPHYTFTGKWYTDAACTTEFNWNSVLTSDTTIYAGWDADGDVTTNFTVAWWVEREDSTGDADQISNYYYSNSTLISNVPLGMSVGAATSVAANGDTGAASRKQHASAINPTTDDPDLRDYFEYHMAKVSYSDGLVSPDGTEADSVITLNGNDTASVDASGKTTLNIFISRTRYTVRYNLAGKGKITYDGTDTTGTWEIPGGGWLDMPFAGKWPLLEADGGNGDDVPKLTVTNGEIYDSWTVPSGYGDGVKTIPILLEKDKLADKTNKVITYTLTTRLRAAATYKAYYYFRDSASDEYTEEDYLGRTYNQTFETYVNLGQKDFTGYTKDTNETKKEGITKEFVGYNAYYTASGTRHYVYVQPGTNGNVLNIHNSDGSLYTANGTIYFTYRSNNGEVNTSAYANSIRNGNDSRVIDVPTIFKFYYTRHTKNIILHDSENPGTTVATVSAMYGESLNGKVNTEDPCSTYEGLNAPTGQEFDGWSSSSESLVPVDFNSTMPDNELHLYAHWRTVQVTVTALSEDKDPEKTRTSTRDINTAFKYFGLTPEEIPGKIFKRWQIVGTTRTVGNNDPINEDITIEPIYEDLRAEPVTYDLNNGQVNDASQTVISGCSVYDEAPAGRIQYRDSQDYVVGGNAPVKALNLSNITVPEGTRKFTYWNTEPDGTGQIYYPGDVVELPAKPAKTILYAIYVQDLTTTIVYDLNYTGQPTQKEVEFKDYIIKNDTELKVNDNYTVGTELNTSTGEFEPMTYAVAGSGGTQYLKAQALWPGHTFLGWDERQTLPEGEAPKYQDGDTIRAVSYDSDGNFQPVQTLYAHWEDNSFPVEVYPIELGSVGDENEAYRGEYNVPASTSAGDIPINYKALRTDTTGQFWAAYLPTINKSAFPTDTTYAYATVDGAKVAELQYAAVTDANDNVIGYKWQYKAAGGSWTDMTTSGTDKTKVKLYYLEPTELNVEYLLKDDEGNLTAIDPETWTGLPAANKTTVTADQDAINSYGTATGGTMVFAEELTHASDSACKLHYVGTGAGPVTVSDVSGVTLSDAFYLQNSDDGILNADSEAGLADSTPKTEAFAVYVVYEERPAYLKIDNACEEDSKDYTFRLTIGGGAYTNALRTDNGSISVASGKSYYDIPIDNGNSKSVYIPCGSGLAYQVQLVKDGTVVSDLMVESVDWGDAGNSGELVRGPQLKSSDAWSFPTDSTKYKLVELKNIGKQALTVTNTIDGEYADMTRRFDVTVTLTKPDATASINSSELPAVDSPAGGTTSPAFELSADGKSAVMTVSLGHNESVNIPAISRGWKYSISEGEHNGYDLTYKTGDGEFVETAPSAVPIGTDDVSVTLKNVFDDEQVVPSGIPGGKYGLFILLLTLMALFSTGLIWFRRRREA